MLLSRATYTEVQKQKKGQVRLETLEKVQKVQIPRMIIPVRGSFGTGPHRKNIELKLFPFYFYVL